MKKVISLGIALASSLLFSGVSNAYWQVENGVTPAYDDSVNYASTPPTNYQQTPKITVKPIAKAPTAPVIKPTTKPKVKVAVKSEVKAETKPIPKKIKKVVKPVTKPAVKAEEKTEIKPAVKPEVKSELKPEVKPEVKPEAKSELKPKTKLEAKSEIKPAKPAIKTNKAIKPKPIAAEKPKTEEKKKPEAPKVQKQMLRETIRNAYPSYTIKYFKVSPTLFIYAKSDIINDHQKILDIIQTKYQIFVYANDGSHIVGVATTQQIAKALTSPYEKILIVQKGKSLQETLNQFARFQGYNLVWNTRKNPTFKKSFILTGKFSNILTECVHNSLGSDYLVEEQKDGKTFIIRSMYIHFTVHEGSLLANIKRFAGKYNYRLIWNVIDPNNDSQIDFSWVGTKKFKNTDATEILRDMLDSYPITVKVWTDNKVICVTNIGSCNLGDRYAQ